MTRIENAFITRGIIVGSKSQKLPDSSDATHSWICYIRPAFNTSLYYIQNITFKLHETFENPVIIKEYPFEIEQNGWGEFTIQIKIMFKDPNERPVNLNHYLILHDEDTVVSEKYEEIVFKSPTNLMYRYLPEEEIKDAEFLKNEDEEGKIIENAIIQMLDKFQ